MAGLTKRNGIYYITWREGGKLRKRSTGTSNKSKAKRFRDQFEREQLQGVDDRFAMYRKIPLSVQLEDYHRYQLAMKVTQKQAKQVKMRITRVLDTAKVTNISELTESRIAAAVASLRVRPQSKKKRASEMPFASARTRNGYLRAILQFCHWLTRDRRMLDNPLIGMKEENEEVDLRHEREPLTEEQFLELHRTASESREIIEGYDGSTRAAIYLLAYATGLRRSEMASLTPESFKLDTESPTVTVEAAFSKHRRRDVVVLPKAVIPLLEPEKWTPGEPIFPRLGQRKTHKMLRLDLEAASIAYRTPEGKYRDLHALRHAYITRVWEAGATPNLARRMARHSDLRATMRYSHTRHEEERRIADRMNGFPKLKKAPEPQSEEENPGDDRSPVTDSE